MYQKKPVYFRMPVVLMSAFYRYCHQLLLTIKQLLTSFPLRVFLVKC